MNVGGEDDGVGVGGKVELCITPGARIRIALGGICESLPCADLIDRVDGSSKIQLSRPDTSKALQARLSLGYSASTDRVVYTSAINYCTQAGSSEKPWFGQRCSFARVQLLTVKTRVAHMALPACREVSRISTSSAIGRVLWRRQAALHCICHTLISQVTKLVSSTGYPECVRRGRSTGQPLSKGVAIWIVLSESELHGDAYTVYSVMYEAGFVAQLAGRLRMTPGLDQTGANLGREYVRLMARKLMSVALDALPNHRAEHYVALVHAHVVKGTSTAVQTDVFWAHCEQMIRWMRKPPVPDTFESMASRALKKDPGTRPG
nr:hypothetical protein CFP56_00603 [Quercus suber]